jgi:hypothetical protein
VTFIQNPGSGNPVFDYSSRDYVNVLTDLLARQQVYLPEWTSQSNNDFGIVLLQEFAYACDILHYYIDRLGNEAFIQTATQPQSILNLASLIGYTPYLSSGATVNLQITIANNLPGGSYPVTIPAGTQFCTTGTSVQSPIIFTTTASLTISGGSTFVGIVAAVQGVQYVSENVAVSNGAVNQAYVLQNNPVSGGNFTVYVNTNPSVGPSAWTFVQTLVGQSPTAMVYTNFVDANQNFYIVFGDGVNGYVPPLGSPITCTYFVNEGAAGNVGANTINTYLNPPAGSPRVTGITGVTNPVAASGGAAQQSIQSIQTQAPAALTTLNRGVTVSDINTLAQNLSGFAWSSAVEVTYQLVNLYMAPNGGGSLNSIQIAAVQTAMASAVMANTTINVLSPTYVPVDIQANIVALPQFSNLAVQQSIVRNLTSLLALGNTGFGFRVSIGDVYQVILQTLGVNYAALSNIITTNAQGVITNTACSGLSRETMVTLTTPLVNGNPYTSLTTSPLPQGLNINDQLQLSNGVNTFTTQVAAAAAVGASTVLTTSFTANANYPATMTTVRDTTLLADAVFLTNEIPTVGVLTIAVTGGTTP